MKKLTKIAGIANAAGAGALAAWAAIVFRMTFGLATKKQMARLTDEKHNDPEMLRQIEEGRTWFLAQHVRSVSVTSFDGLLLKGHYLTHPQAKRTIVAFHGFKTHALFDFGATARFFYFQSQSAKPCFIKLDKRIYIAQGFFIRFTHQ